MTENWKGFLFTLWLLVSTITVLAALLFIFGYIGRHGVAAVNLEFLLSGPKGVPLGAEGGIFPAIIGSLGLFAIACLSAGILALSTAVYLVFYCRSKKIDALAHMVIQCLAGIPSIVIGLFGYSLLVVNLGLGRSLLAAGLTLGIMIFPFIEVRVEKTLREAGHHLIVSSYALGVSKAYTLFKLVLPICLSDIVSAVTLAGGFAMGAAAPIILTGAVIFAPVPDSLLSPVMALPFHLYILTNEGISLEKAYATALVLVALVFAINVISIILTLRQREVRS
ncbi:MAG TPA: ABC transporter permease subunit [Clostridia bacterium]|nr:ABC transporter permease subunit [Clostridia bacterium]